MASHRLHRRAHGFTLIEVLVSIVVLSFGVLGMVGLQASSLQATRETRQQSASVRLAKELAQLMRGNQAIAVQADASKNPYLVDYSGGTRTAPAANCFTSDACQTSVPSDSQTKVATWEVDDWLSRVDQELPGARVKVCFDATPYASDGLPQWDCSDTGGVAIVKIGWTQRRFNSASSTTDEVLDQATRPSVVLPLTAGHTS